jgi:raffinose/stachyose/melibiose transport system substrate-binding protein
MQLRVASMMIVFSVCIAVVSAFADRQTMIIWNIDTSYAQWFDDMYKPFEQQNNVDIKISTVPSEDFHVKFISAVQAKSQIDALTQNGQDVRWMATDGLLKDLTSAVTYKDRFVASALIPYTIGGKLYGIPYGAMNTSALYYNKEIFAKYKLTPPKTYDDLVKAVKELNKNGIYGIAMGGATIYMWPMWFFQTFAQTSSNNSDQVTRETLQGKRKFTDPEYVKSMQALYNFGKDGIFEPGVNGVDDRGGAQAIFTSGKAAMFYGGTWEIDALRNAGMTANQLGILKFPKITNNSMPVQMTGGSGNAATIYSGIDQSRLRLAEKFVDFVTSDSIDQAYCEKAKNPLAINVKVELGSADPLAKQLRDEFLPNTVTFLDWTWPQKIVSAFQEQIQAVTGQQTTPEKAVQAIQKTYDDLVTGGYQFK